jgi:TIR domain-containing protein
MYRIFISHGSGDNWVASQMARRIKQDAKAETFLDVFDIAKGDDFETKIFEILRQSDELVALLSPWSVNRNWVWTEIGAARVLEKRILGVLNNVRIETLSSEGGGMACLSSRNVLSINEFEIYLAELKMRVKEAAK